MIFLACVHEPGILGSKTILNQEALPKLESFHFTGNCRSNDIFRLSTAIKGSVLNGFTQCVATEQVILLFFPHASLGKFLVNVSYKFCFQLNQAWWRETSADCSSTFYQINFTSLRVALSFPSHKCLLNSFDTTTQSFMEHGLKW